MDSPDFAGAFNNQEHADVHLHLSIANEDEPSAAKKRTPTMTHARSYHLHSIILSSRSQYFEGRLHSRFNAQAADASARSVSIVHHVREEELEAAELLLRAMYDIEVDASTDVTLLLCAMKQADFFLPSKSVVQLLCRGLAAVPIGAITVDVMHLAMSVHPLPGEFVVKCLPSMFQVFGSAPDVATSHHRLSLFCALKHASVVAWAEADLHVGSARGNTTARTRRVLSSSSSTHCRRRCRCHGCPCREHVRFRVLTRWLKAQERGGVSSCSKAQVQQLADVFIGWKPKPGAARPLDPYPEAPSSSCWVRGFLGNRLLEVFGNVPAVVTTPHLLTRFCVLSHPVVMSWASCGGLQVHSENDVVYLLTEWVRAQAAGGPCSPAELAQLVCKFRQEKGLWSLGVYVKVTEMAVPWPPSAAMAFRFSAIAGNVTRPHSKLEILKATKGLGWLDALNASSASVAALVAPHLVDGKLKGQIIVSDVDCVGRS
ncbi:hypothetical protein FOA52_014293 [Chlamydomonas sp. UWO 241]|nr:hypothetical protein FOA52_014293 [Chlamydomonas sp. UWO 241]